MKMYLVHVSVAFQETGIVLAKRKSTLGASEFLKEWNAEDKLPSSLELQKTRTKRGEEMGNGTGLEPLEARLHPTAGVILEEETRIIWIKA